MVGRGDIRDALTKPKETQVMTSLAITDTSDHDTSIDDVSLFNMTTVYVISTLDQNANCQIYANRASSATDAVTVGASFTITAGCSQARTILPATDGWLPYVFIRVVASAAPSSGNISIYNIKKPQT